MVKLKKGSTIHRTLQNAVVAVINDSSYSFSFPEPLDWESIVSSSSEEKQRLEFVGDAVMHLSVALYLYRLFPNAAPGLYTNIRSAVNANATFTHLMVKAGAYKLPSQSHSTKAVADSFEVIVGALYLERGFADVCAWVQEQFAPLIAAARDSYDRCLTNSDQDASVLSVKRHLGPRGPTATPLLKKARLSSGRSFPRSTLMAQRVINRMKSKGKVKLCLPTKKSTHSLEMRLHSCKRRTPGRPPSLVIDLTMDSESTDDEPPPPNGAQQVPQSRLEQFDLCQQHLFPTQRDTPSSNVRSDKCCVSHRSSQQSSTLLLALSHPSPVFHSSVASSPATTPPPRSASLRIPVGSHESPIIIEDSDTEN